MDWIVANWAGIVAAVTGVVTAASLIARLTPTTHDDEFIAAVLKAINFLALNKPAA